MYKVSVMEDGTVMDVYDPDIYMDEGVETFAITDAEFKKISASGNHSIWRLENGVIVQQEPPEPKTIPEGFQKL